MVVVEEVHPHIIGIAETWAYEDVGNKQLDIDEHDRNGLNCVSSKYCRHIRGIQHSLV